jgi:mannose-6-phosphate isomerase
VPKLWGSLDLRPWNALGSSGVAIGEIWFERTVTDATEPSLLLKLLFANEPLSIQVHPGDGFAQSIGLPRGKTEAWYILSASPDAKVAVGLKRRVTPQQLRAAIEDASIVDLVRWHHVRTGDVIYVPAGTIHAIGPGLVIAEIQQRSDATFRMFDFGRGRDLQVDNAVAVAHAGTVRAQGASKRLANGRTLLIACPYFVLERIDLAPDMDWQLNAFSETWLLVLDGHAQVGPTSLLAGEAVFLNSTQATVRVGASRLSGLVAYQETQPRHNLWNAITGRTAGLPVPSMGVPS